MESPRNRRGLRIAHDFSEWRTGLASHRLDTPPLAGAAACGDAALKDAAIARFKQLTEAALPARAREARWPIRLDHCFKRICLDYAFGDVWYNHLPRPAERHLAGEPLQRAIQCAEDLLAGDRALLDQRNTESLRYRGKLRGPSASR